MPYLTYTHDDGEEYELHVDVYSETDDWKEDEVTLLAIDDDDDPTNWPEWVQEIDLDEEYAHFIRGRIEDAVGVP